MSGLKAGDVIIVVKILSFKVHKPDITRAKWAAQCCQVGNAGFTVSETQNDRNSREIVIRLSKPQQKSTAVLLSLNLR